MGRLLPYFGAPCVRNEERRDEDFEDRYDPGVLGLVWLEARSGVVGSGDIVPAEPAGGLLRSDGAYAADCLDTTFFRERGCCGRPDRILPLSVTIILEALDKELSGVAGFSPKPLSVLSIAMVWQASGVLLEASMRGLGMVIGDDVGDESVEQPSAGCMVGDESIMTEGFEAERCCYRHYYWTISKRNMLEDNRHSEGQ
jgi:hypothetical protein